MIPSPSSNLAGVDASSFYHTPLKWSLFDLTAGVPPATAPFASNLTFEYAGSTPFTASTPPGTQAFLGQFEVISTYDFPIGVVPYPEGDNTITFTYTIDGNTQQGSGSFQISAIPEPSSVILLAAGVSALPMVWLRKRWRRAEQAVF